MAESNRPECESQTSWNEGQQELDAPYLGVVGGASKHLRNKLLNGRKGSIRLIVRYTRRCTSGLYVRHIIIQHPRTRDQFSQRCIHNPISWCGRCMLMRTPRKQFQYQPTPRFLINCRTLGDCQSMTSRPCRHSLTDEQLPSDDHVGEDLRILMLRMVHSLPIFGLSILARQPTLLFVPLCLPCSLSSESSGLRIIVFCDWYLAGLTGLETGCWKSSSGSISPRRGATWLLEKEPILLHRLSRIHGWTGYRCLGSFPAWSDHLCRVSHLLRVLIAPPHEPGFGTRPDTSEGLPRALCLLPTLAVRSHNPKHSGMLKCPFGSSPDHPTPRN